MITVIMLLCIDANRHDTVLAQSIMQWILLEIYIILHFYIKFRQAQNWYTNESPRDLGIDPLLIPEKIFSWVIKNIEIPTSSIFMPFAVRKKSPYKLYIYLLCAPIIIPALYLFGTTNNFLLLEWRHNERSVV